MADTGSFRAALEALRRVRGIRGALIVEQSGGVPVVAEIADGVDATAVAALASSLYRRAGRGTGGASAGALEMLQLDGARGHLIVAGAGELLVVAVADPDAQLGLIRVHARRAAAEIS